MVYVDDHRSPRITREVIGLNPWQLPTSRDRWRPLYLGGVPVRGVVCCVVSVVLRPGARPGTCGMLDALRGQIELIHTLSEVSHHSSLTLSIHQGRLQTRPGVNRVKVTVIRRQSTTGSVRNVIGVFIVRRIRKIVIPVDLGTSLEASLRSGTQNGPALQTKNQVRSLFGNLNREIIIVPNFALTYKADLGSGNGTKLNRQVLGKFYRHLTEPFTMLTWN